MDLQTQKQIDDILADVKSIQEVTEDIYYKLRESLAGRITIEKFKVTEEDFEEWDAQLDKPGIEYDAQAEKVIIKATASPLHRSVCDVIGRWFCYVRSRVQHATNHVFETSGSSGIELSGKYRGSIKVPDKLLLGLSDFYPTIVLEVGVSETLGRLFQDAKKWLDGSEGVTELVIIVDIQERFPPAKKVGEPSSTWGLSDEDILQEFVGHSDLADHILAWHDKNGTSILGRFTADLYFCAREEPQPDRVWRCEFSLHEEDVTLHPDNILTLTSMLRFYGVNIVLPLGRLQTEMSDSLERHARCRARTQAIEKLKALRGRP